MTSSRVKLKIDSDELSLRQLKELLESEASWEDVPVDLKLEENPFRTRSVEPGVLIALINVAGAGLVALISELLKILIERNKGKIIVKTDNITVEIPYKTSAGELSKILSKVQSEQVEEILVEV